MPTDHSPLLPNRNSGSSVYSDEFNRADGVVTVEMESPSLSHGAGGTVFSSACNLLNTILGTGMLAMPHAVSTGGAIVGACTIIFAGCTAALGLYFLSCSSTHAPPRKASFFALSQITYPAASKLFDAAIAVKCFGVSISYLIILGALAPKVVSSFVDNPPDWLLDRRFWILISMIALVPLSFLRTLHALRFTSYIALVAVADLVIIIIWKFFDESDLTPRGNVVLGKLSPSLISSLPVYIFAFTCAQNLFSIINELQNNTQHRVNTAISGSIMTATVVYEIVGLLGYFIFGDTVGSNIAEMFPHGFLVAVCRVGIVLLVLFSYPLQLHPCRASLDKVLRQSDIPYEKVSEMEEEGEGEREEEQQGDASNGNDNHRNTEEFDQRRRKEEQKSSTEESHEAIPPIKFAVMTSAILIVSFMIALNVSQLEVVLSFVGSTGSTTISFILPSLFYLKLFPERKTTSQIVHRILAYFLLAFGIVVMIASLTLNVIAATRR